MTNKTLKIYWQSECRNLLNDIKGHMEEVFGLVIVLAGELEPPASALDLNRQQYDVNYLLPVLENDGLSLWILNVDISDPTHIFLYGVASDKKAIASAFRTGNDENFLKEVCHEVGHMMGLDHCRNKCLMQTSRNIKQLDKKPLYLCNKCTKNVEKKLTQITK
ncbi:MAG TPA: hypothetical protein VFC73_08645 [Syntrophomonadaceae bacterium]|nr:hypothetical protein [Syntrophomonadaceae bacterium]